MVPTKFIIYQNYWLDPIDVHPLLIIWSQSVSQYTAKPSETQLWLKMLKEVSQSNPQSDKLIACYLEKS
jgi:hypothetical protein